MEFIPTPLKDLLLICTDRKKDFRGSFQKYFDTQNSPLKSFRVNQLNHSINAKEGTLRGMHFQNVRADAKIVICTKGSIFDCVVDIRANSPTFGQKFSVILSEHETISLYIPKGFAHGFQTMEKDSHVLYLHDEDYLPSQQNGISPLCNSLAIEWPLKVSSISERDSNLPDFMTFIKLGANQ